MTPIRLSAFGGTDIGRRSQNQDLFTVDHFAGVYAVADGVGGYDGGEIASRLAIQTLTRFFERAGDASNDDASIREARMDLAFRMAHQEVARARTGALAQMGTTLAALRVESDGAAVIAHVGDSRIYRYRSSRLEALTRDHSLLEELRAAGVPEAYRAANGHILTRALGVGEPGHEVVSVTLEPSDRYLICSDGLSGSVSHRRLWSILSSAPNELVIPALISEAWRNDARDNITAVVVSVD